MRLTGALSNHDVGAGLEGALERKRQLPPRAQGAEQRLKLRLRLPMGAIQAAAIEVLQDADDALMPLEVRTRVEKRLQTRISQNTISSFLSVACRSGDSPVQRVGHALYRITE